MSAAGYLDQIDARADTAHEHIGALAAPDARWTMSIPVRDTDSDVLLTATATDAERASAAALRAVLDLHKPYEWELDVSSGYSCEVCENDGVSLDYPCPTVEAITDALAEGGAA